MIPKKICVEHEIRVNPRVETLHSAEWRLNELGAGEKSMTVSELRKAADFLDCVLDPDAIDTILQVAVVTERNVNNNLEMRRILERLTVPITVRAGDVAALLHWVQDHACLIETPVPNAVFELMKTIANVHAELLEGVA